MYLSTAETNPQAASRARENWYWSKYEPKSAIAFFAASEIASSCAVCAVCEG